MHLDRRKFIQVAALTSGFPELPGVSALDAVKSALRPFEPSTPFNELFAISIHHTSRQEVKGAVSEQWKKDQLAHLRFYQSHHSISILGLEVWKRWHHEHSKNDLNVLCGSLKHTHEQAVQDVREGNDRFKSWVKGKFPSLRYAEMDIAQQGYVNNCVMVAAEHRLGPSMKPFVEDIAELYGRLMRLHDVQFDELLRDVNIRTFNYWRHGQMHNSPPGSVEAICKVEKEKPELERQIHLLYALRQGLTRRFDGINPDVFAFDQVDQWIQDGRKRLNVITRA